MNSTTYEGFLLADHDWCLQVQVDYDEQFVVARLEEQMLDVAK